MAYGVYLIDANTGLPYVASGSGGGTGTNASQVQGTSSSGAADDGSNPVKVGGVVTSIGTSNATPVPQLATGTRNNFILNRYGAQLSQLTTHDGYLITGGYQADAVPNTTFISLATIAFSSVWNGTAWDRQRGDVTGTWTHNPPSTVSSALSGTIAASGATVAITMTNTTRTEVINPSTATLWASWGTPAVNGAGSFPINAGGTYSPPDRTAGTLTLLSTAATQPYTVNRFS